MLLGKYNLTKHLENISFVKNEKNIFFHQKNKRNIIQKVLFYSIDLLTSKSKQA